MSHPAASAVSRRRVPDVIGAALIIGVSACGDEAALIASAPACQAPTEIEAASRGSLATWASGLPYAANDSTAAYTYGFSASDSVRIQAVDSASAGTPTGCIMGQLTSPSARPASGIGAGRTYIWVDSITSGYRLVLIPEDPSVPMTAHTIAVHEHDVGDPPPPIIGVLGFCGYCDYTAKRWCRGGLDSAATTALR